MISAAMSMSRIAIHLRPRLPRVRLRASHASATAKVRQTMYLTQAGVAGPVTIWPSTVRSGIVIWPDAE